MRLQQTPSAEQWAESWRKALTRHPLLLPLSLSLVAHLLLFGSYQMLRRGTALPANPVWLQMAMVKDQPPIPFVTLMIVAGSEADSVGPEPSVESPPDPALPPPPAPRPSDPIEEETKLKPLPAQIELPAPVSAPREPDPQPIITAPLKPSAPPPEPVPPKFVMQLPSMPPLPLVKSASTMTSASANDSTIAIMTNIAAGVDAPALAEQARAVGEGPVTTANRMDHSAGATGSQTQYLGPALRSPPNLARYYPNTARSRGITGTTTLVLGLDAKGRIESTRVMASNPPDVFEDSAKRVARTLRFHPASRAGQPVPAEFTLTIQWQLQH